MSTLAILGGTPVRGQGYPLWPQHDEREVEAVAAVVRSGVWGGHPAPAPNAARFIERFAAYQGARYGAVMMNGTVTLEVALKALGIGWGDEVIVPAVTFEATYYACVAAGALPVIVDVTEDTLTIDPGLVEAAITPRTKAIIPVHLGHQVADMDRIMDIAGRHSLAVVEDAAHAHGQQWGDKGAGCIGDFGSFSHQSSKSLTAGEGGTLLTQDPHLAELATSILDCGRPQDAAGKEYTYGANYRLGELHAALLLAQLDRFEEQRVERERAARYFEEHLREIPGVRVMPADPRVTRWSFYQYVFAIDPDAFAGAGNDVVCRALEAEGVPADTGFQSARDAELFQVSLSRLPAAVEYADRLNQAGMRFEVADRVTRREQVFVEHSMFLSGTQGIDDALEAVAKVQAGSEALVAAEVAPA
jgi:dTDP-4-amino-4,6-dideoxygalactose transaminase